MMTGTCSGLAGRYGAPLKRTAAPPASAQHQCAGRMVPRLGHAIEAEVERASQELDVFAAGAVQRRQLAQPPALARRELPVDLLADPVADIARWEAGPVAGRDRPPSSVGTLPLQRRSAIRSFGTSRIQPPTVSPVVRPGRRSWRSGRDRRRNWPCRRADRRPSRPRRAGRSGRRGRRPSRPLPRPPPARRAGSSPARRPAAAQRRRRPR